MFLYNHGFFHKNYGILDLKIMIYLFVKYWRIYSINNDKIIATLMERKKSFSMGRSYFLITEKTYIFSKKYKHLLYKIYESIQWVYIYTVSSFDKKYREKRK